MVLNLIDRVDFMTSIYPGYKKQVIYAREEFVRIYSQRMLFWFSSARAGLVLGLKAFGFSRKDEI